MAPRFSPSFWEELRQRRVFRAVAVYGVSAWVVVQVADTFFPALRMPEWTVTLVASLAVLGFPVTVALAWIFERTPEGVRRSPEGDGHRGVRQETGTTGTPAASGGRFFAALALGAAAGLLVIGFGIWLGGAFRGGGLDELSGSGLPLALAGGAAAGVLLTGLAFRLAGPAALERAPAESGDVVLAVLPFETVGESTSTLADGIHGDLLTRLAGVSDLGVISRGSVMRYRDPAVPSREVAAALGAGWLLRGEVQEVGGQVRVHARLVEGWQDRQVWAEGYRRDLTTANIFDIQREITHQIVEALEGRLAPGEWSMAEQSSTDDLEAYRLYVQGRGLLGPRTERSMRRAIDYFQRAIALDPGYAAAWAGVADALIFLTTFGYQAPPGSVDPRQAAERALEFRPDLAEAHFALANLAHAERNNREAVLRLERAVELRPSYADAHNLLSWIHKLDGDPEAGLNSAKRAVELDPLASAPLSNLALAHLVTGDPEAAAREARRIGDFAPDFPTAPFFEGLALYHQGQFAEAAARLEGVHVPWAGAGPRAAQVLAELRSGEVPGSEGVPEDIDPAADPFSHALVLAGLGDRDPLMKALQQQQRWGYWPTLVVRYLFPELLVPVRARDDYPRLLRRIEADWGWSEPRASLR